MTKQMEPQYSGDLSRPFWGRIDRIRRTKGSWVEWCLLYSFGCALQDLEGKVLRALFEAEVRAEGKKVRPKEKASDDFEAHVGILLKPRKKLGRFPRLMARPLDCSGGKERPFRLKPITKAMLREDSSPLHRKVLRLCGKPVSAKQVAARLDISVRSASAILRTLRLFHGKDKHGDITYCCFR